MAYAAQLESLDEKETEQFHEELYAPLDPEIARAERNMGRWLTGR